MADHFYLDCSALMRWSEGDVDNPAGRDADGRTEVPRILAEETAIVGFSELTLLETAGSLAGSQRDDRYPKFDAEWRERSFSALMAAIADGQLIEVPMPSKAAEQAMMLAGDAARTHGIAFRTWDAMHLTIALAWASDVGSKVHLVTSDVDFRKFFVRYPHFESFRRAPRDLD